MTRSPWGQGTTLAVACGMWPVAENWFGELPHCLLLASGHWPHAVLKGVSTASPRLLWDGEAAAECLMLHSCCSVHPPVCPTWLRWGGCRCGGEVTLRAGWWAPLARLGFFAFFSPLCQGGWPGRQCDGRGDRLSPSSGGGGACCFQGSGRLCGGCMGETGEARRLVFREQCFRPFPDPVTV